MRYETIDKTLYIHNRERFKKALKPGSMAIFNSNDIMPTNADGTMPFRQNNDILHLSGIDQEESILVIFPDATLPEHREILFLKETNDEIAIWEGEKYTREAAYEASGIKTVYWLQQFEQVLHALMTDAKHIYLNSNEQSRANIEVETRDMRFNKWIQEKYPLHEYERSAPIMHDIRAIKHDIEIQLMQKACDITESAFRRVLEFVKPGVNEYEIEAEIIHEFVRNRSRGFAYTPIIASGFNACVLHYIENKAECKDGDVLLMDIGAEYANYAADMSRSIPVNGRYTERQKAVYNAVRRVQVESIKMLRPGTLLHEFHKEVGKLMESELIGLGLLDKHDVAKQDPKKPVYKKFFMHGTSHFIGLDVHDVGDWSKPIQPGMVFTCEPGIYIREENLGIRLENDLVVTDGEPFDLMGNIPIEADEIEEIMNS